MGNECELISRCRAASSFQHVDLRRGCCGRRTPDATHKLYTPISALNISHYSWLSVPLRYALTYAMSWPNTMLLKRQTKDNMM
jgi:hypothetical protein